MPSTLPASALLGSNTASPFKGHLGMAVGSGRSTGWIAVRVGASCTVPDAYEQVLQLHKALEDIQADDALHLARATWDRLLVVPRQSLGPLEGSDLSALLITRSQDCTTLSGAGLSHVWGWSEEKLILAAQPHHPELAAPGLPTLPPKALVIKEPATLYLGCPTGEDRIPETPGGALTFAGLTE